jgi:phosphoglycerol transferase MdoB-like AlkP superfamily enzyme
MNYLENKYSKIAALTLLGVLISIQIFAQDGGLDIDIDLGKPEWYEQPWVWVVGAAAFILILVALMRRKR